MCISVSFKTEDHYFGRNLDLEYTYYETVTVTPRNKEFQFRHMGRSDHHYAIISMAFVVGGNLRHYEEANKIGQSISRQYFPDNSHYFNPKNCRDNVASYELTHQY